MQSPATVSVLVLNSSLPLSLYYLYLNQGGRSCTGARVAPAEKLDSDENFKPEHTLFCHELRFVAKNSDVISLVIDQSQPGVFYLQKMTNFMKPGVLYLQKMINFMKMRTFYKKNYLFL